MEYDGGPTSRAGRGPGAAGRAPADAASRLLEAGGTTLLDYIRSIEYNSTHREETCSTERPDSACCGCERNVTLSHLPDTGPSRGDHEPVHERTRWIVDGTP